MIETIPIVDREQWLRLRLRDLTASDVAAAAGFDAYRSALSVYAEKAGLVPPQGDTPIMRRGRWLEPAVLAALREECPDWEVRPARVYLRDTATRLGATPDAVASSPTVDGVINVQCKVVSRPVFERDWPDGRPPIAYEVQTTVENLLMDAAHGVIAALVVSTFDADLHLWQVRRHGAAELRAIAVAREFWQRIADRQPPEHDWSKDAELVERLHPDAIAEKEVDLTRDNRVGAILAEIETISDVTEAAAARVAALETELKAKLGDAASARVTGWRVTWKAQKRKPSFVGSAQFRVLRYTREKA